MLNPHKYWVLEVFCQWGGSVIVQSDFHKFSIVFPRTIWSVVASSRRWYELTMSVMTFIVPGYEHESDGISQRMDGVRIYGAHMNPANTTWTYPTGSINFQLLVIGC